MGCCSRAWFALMRRNLIYRKRFWLSTVRVSVAERIARGTAVICDAGENLMAPVVSHSSRTCVSQILELVLPLVFILFLVAIKSAVQNGGSFAPEVVDATFPDVAVIPLSFTDYVTALRAKRVCIEQEGGFEITGISNNGYNWQVPMVKCDSRRCEYDGQDAQPLCQFSILAVAGSDAGGAERATAFKTWVLSTYPEITEAENSLPYKFELVQTFDSASAMNDYVKSRDYGTTASPKIAMGVVWAGNDASNYDYQLRPNSTNFNAPENESQPATQTTPGTTVTLDSYANTDSVCDSSGGTPTLGPFQSSCTGLYLYNGVLTFQRLVHDFVLASSGATLAGYAVAEAGVQFVPFPSRPYQSNGFYSTIEGTRVHFTLRVFCRSIEFCTGTESERLWSTRAHSFALFCFCPSFRRSHGIHKFYSPPL